MNQGKRIVKLSLAALIAGFGVSVFGYWVAMGFALGIVLVPYALRSPFNAFQLVIATLPLEAAFVLEIGFTVRMAYLFLILTLFVMTATKSLALPNTPLDMPLVAYLSVAAFSVVQTIFFPPDEVGLLSSQILRGMSGRGMVQLFILGLMLLTFYLTVLFNRQPQAWRRSFGIYLTAATIAAIYGIYQIPAIYLDLPFRDINNALITGGVGRGEILPFWETNRIGIYRVRSTFQEPLNLANFLLSVLPVVLALYLGAGRGKERVRLAAIAGTLFLALFFTFARGGWLGFLAALAVLAVGVPAKKEIGRIALLMLGVGAAGMAVFRLVVSKGSTLGISQLIFNRFDIVPADMARVTYITTMFELLKDHLLLGVGWGNLPLQLANRLGLPVLVSAHGVWWQALGESGILGFVVLCWVVGAWYLTMLRTLSRVRGTDWYFYILGFIASLTGMLVQYFSFGDRLSMYVWFVMGMAVAVTKMVGAERKDRGGLSNAQGV
ncbi:MAG: O-antigen ligase family protein [Firmicutes bacterium]|nr:O-antigen ligase family protein [Bacillota bacterium]